MEVHLSIGQNYRFELCEVLLVYAIASGAL